MSNKYVHLTAFVALAAFSFWQWAQGRSLQQSNADLMTQVKVLTAATATMPPASAADRRAPGAPASPPAPEAALAAAASALPARSPEDVAREARFREFRQVDRAQRVDSRILALKTNVNISPAQETVIRAAMAKGSQDRDALRESSGSRTRGTEEEERERRRQDGVQFAAIDAAQEAAITASLSAEQLTAYEEQKTAQRKTEVENQANRQLGDLQNRLTLTEEQKDAVFQQFAEQAQSFDWRETMAQGTDMQVAMEEQLKLQLEAMQQILTPEQYELYQKQEEERAGMFRNGGFAPPGGF
jgi:hypothetical protein